MSSKRLIPFEEIASGHPCFLDTETGPDWSARFGNDHPLKLEIGFGNGNFLLEWAVREPGSNFIGMDFYHKGIRKTIMRLDRFQISNVQIVYGNARERVPLLFQDGELSEILINFPDPWPKKRHHKRRLIQPEFVKTLAAKLKPSGRLRVATDFEPYALEILAVLNAETELTNKHPDSGFSHERDDIPKSKYEKNFIKAGKAIYYFDFTKDPQYALSSSTETACMG